ncbi:MAG TPA: FAD binding domain-containing protein [Gaiellaceae bacterium]
MIPAELEYVRPTTLDDALAALAAEGAVPIAGGHSLVPMLKTRLARPSLVVDVRDVLPRGISGDRSSVTIGAATTWRDLSAAREVPELVRECASGIGDLQVRNHGTAAGSLAHADPASDFAAVALATDASLRLLSASGERVVAAADFFVGPFTTVLAQGELIVEIVLPAEYAGSAYVAVEDPASGYALAGAAVCVYGGGRSAIGLTGATAVPVRLDAVTSVDELDVLADARTDAGYRRRLAAVVIERALARATERAA